jgi:hypothetical protein
VNIDEGTQLVKSSLTKMSTTQPPSKVPKIEPSSPSSVPSTPTPIASSSTGTVAYLSDEEKAKLFAKYGQIAKPKPSEVAEVAGAGCRTQ